MAITSDKEILTWEGAVAWLRSQPSQRDLVVAAYYDDPIIDAALRYYGSSEWNAIRQYFPSLSGHALDVGAGRGIASFSLAKDGFNVTALEPDESTIVGVGAIKELVKYSGLNIEIVKDYSERLPFGDKTFDLVFARAVLHHTVDLDRACAEFFRVLKPGGKLIAVREHVISRPEHIQEFLDKHPLHKLYGGENAFVLGVYKAALKNAGFQIDKVIKPLDSPINYSPNTEDQIKNRIATVLSLRNKAFYRIIQFLLQSRVVWQTVLPFLSLIDSRPGRLYSFVATRPDRNE